MDTNNNIRTIKVPFFNNFNGINNFDIRNNKFIAEQQIKENSKLTDGIISLGTKITTLRYEFNLPDNYIKNLDFESDVTITYQVKDNELYLINIDAQYSEEYLENIEANINVFPVFNNGYISYLSENEDSTIDTAC
jgi:hypothetical protein